MYQWKLACCSDLSGCWLELAITPDLTVVIESVTYVSWNVSICENGDWETLGPFDSIAKARDTAVAILEQRLVDLGRLEDALLIDPALPECVDSSYRSGPLEDFDPRF